MPAHRSRAPSTISLEVNTDATRAPSLAIISPTPRQLAFPSDILDGPTPRAAAFPPNVQDNSPFASPVSPTSTASCPSPSSASTASDSSTPSTTHSAVSSSPLKPFPMIERPFGTLTPPPAASTSSHRRRGSAASLSSQERKPKKGDSDYIKRPENAFILFRRQCCVDKNAELAAAAASSSSETPAQRRQRQADLSKSISQQWKSLSSEERAYWDDLAKQRKKEHEEMYPWYVYQPSRSAKPRASKNSKSVSPNTKSRRGSVTGSSAESSEEFTDMTDSETSSLSSVPASRRASSAPTRPPAMYEGIKLPTLFNAPSCPSSPFALPYAPGKQSGKSTTLTVPSQDKLGNPFGFQPFDVHVMPISPTSPTGDSITSPQLQPLPSQQQARFAADFANLQEFMASNICAEVPTTPPCASARVPVQQSFPTIQIPHLPPELTQLNSAQTISPTPSVASSSSSGPSTPQRMLYPFNTMMEPSVVHSPTTVHSGINAVPHSLPQSTENTAKHHQQQQQLTSTVEGMGSPFELPNWAMPALSSLSSPDQNSNAHSMDQQMNHASLDIASIPPISLDMPLNMGMMNVDMGMQMQMPVDMNMSGSGLNMNVNMDFGAMLEALQVGGCGDASINAANNQSDTATSSASLIDIDYEAFANAGIDLSYGDVLHSTMIF